MLCHFSILADKVYECLIQRYPITYKKSVERAVRLYNMLRDKYPDNHDWKLKVFKDLQFLNYGGKNGKEYS